MQCSDVTVNPLHAANRRHGYQKFDAGPRVAHTAAVADRQQCERQSQRLPVERRLCVQSRIVQQPQHTQRIVRVFAAERGAPGAHARQARAGRARVRKQAELRAQVRPVARRRVHPRGDARPARLDMARREAQLGARTRHRLHRELDPFHGGQWIHEAPARQGAQDVLLRPLAPDHRARYIDDDTLLSVHTRGYMLR